MDCVVMGASASGLIRGYLPYTKETNININIQGHPASGKSTICHFALSMFGNPEKLEGSFTDTDNSMEEIRVRRPVLPYILDERMLKNNGAEKSKSADLLTDVFREYEGKVKERLGKQYAENAGERTYGPIISSSVGKMMDIMLLEQAKDFGQYRRFMEFYVDNKVENQLFSDADEAKEVEQVAYKHYGFGVKIVVDYMLDLITYGYRDGDGSLLSGYEDNDLIMAEFSNLDSKISKRLQAEEEKEKNLNLAPSSKRLTMIVYSYQILRDALLYHNKLKSERKTKTYIEQQYNNAVLESAQSSEAEEFAKNILDYVSKTCKSDIENNEVKVRIGKARTQCNDEIALIISNIYQYDRREAQKKILNIIHGFHNQCIKGSCQNDNFSQNEIEACEKAIRGSFDKLYKRIVDDDEEIRRNIVLNITVNNKDDEENIIKDRTEEVIELLVNNLVEKMKVIKDREIPEYRIYDYFLKNKEKFYKCEYLNETWEDSNHCRYLGKYIERKNGIELILDNKLGTEKFLFSQTIPEPEQIFEYMQVKDKLNSIENPTDALKNMEKTLREAYHAVSNSEIDRYCRIHDIIRKKKILQYVFSKAIMKGVRTPICCQFLKNQLMRKKNRQGTAR